MKILLIVITLLWPALGPRSRAEDWRRKFSAELPLFGHRNWIAVVDSAYPLQISPGIEMIYVADDQMKIVEEVLAALARTAHLRPIIYIDAELKHVTEEQANGITAYRELLNQAFYKRDVTSIAHEQIISKLNEAGNNFHVLVLKTPQTLPYTSVFFELDCAYWNPDAEKKLRDAMKAAK